MDNIFLLLRFLFICKEQKQVKISLDVNDLFNLMVKYETLEKDQILFEFNESEGENSTAGINILFQVSFSFFFCYIISQ